jgi:hypothetical protein
MDEENQKKHDELVSEIANQGELTRKRSEDGVEILENTFSKFETVFYTMNASIQDQGNTLLDILDVQKKLLDVEIDAVEAEKRKEALQSVERTEIGSRADIERTPSARASREEKTDKPSLGFLSNLFEKLGPGLSTLIGVGLAGAASLLSARTLGGIMLRAIPLVTLAPFIGEFVGDLIEQSLMNIGLLEPGEGFDDSFKSELNDVINWTIIGGALGGWWGAKMGFLFAAGSILWKEMDRLFNLNENLEKIANAFGLELSDDWQSAIGSAIGFAVIAIMPAILRRVLVPFLLSNIGKITAAASAALGIGAAARPNARPATRPAGPATRTAAAAPLLGRLLPPVAATAGIWEIGKLLESGELGTPEGRERIRASWEEAIVNFATDMGIEVSPRNRDDIEIQPALVGEIASSNIRKNDDDMFADNRFSRFLGMPTVAGPIVSDEPGTLITNEMRRQQEYNAEQIEALFNFIEQLAYQEEHFDTFNMVFTHSLLEAERLGLDVEKIAENFRMISAANSSKEYSDEDIIRLNEELRQELNEIENMNLHPMSYDGSETIMPGTSAFAPVLDIITNAAHTSITNVVYAPTTIAPVSTITQGGSSVSSVTTNAVTSIGSGGGSGLGRFAV